MGKYVVDFYCAGCKLVVEVDGDSHGEQIEYDEKRANELKEVGYEVIRFTNRQVASELENVLEVILNECLQLQARSLPSPYPSPSKGEGTCPFSPSGRGLLRIVIWGGI